MEHTARPPARRSSSSECIPRTETWRLSWPIVVPGRASPADPLTGRVSGTNECMRDRDTRRHPSSGGGARP